MTLSESWLPNERVAVWPRPRSVSSGKTAASLPVRLSAGDLFLHRAGCCADLLQHAFMRYHRHIFWVAEGESPLPHLRARAVGLRSTSAPRERRYCAADTASLSTFKRLDVEVRASEPTELVLGVDESYELTLHEQGGVLIAPTEWGALRGIETFSQLVQWTGAEHRLCGLPLRVSDGPRYAWRGLLLDTARHYLPLPSLLAMLNGMESLKLNVFHWHLTDGSSFSLGSEAPPPPNLLGLSSSPATSPTPVNHSPLCLSRAQPGAVPTPLPSAHRHGPRRCCPSCRHVVPTRLVSPILSTRCGWL
jgi:hypothetical protein